MSYMNVEMSLAAQSVLSALGIFALSTARSNCPDIEVCDHHQRSSESVAVAEGRGWAWACRRLRNQNKMDGELSQNILHDLIILRRQFRDGSECSFVNENGRRCIHICEKEDGG
jgi:hypothetical protein